MTILAYIDYGFIVLFFLTVGSLVVVISRPHDKVLVAGEKLPQVRQKKIAYAALAGIFLFFLLVTWMTNRQADI
jgi:asparagine N-glycosylation enzyme membrane subunit Stt3